ncbi:uncharacterized protein [Anas platyrhynchos]|uniref:uncharacterized protein isoform X2 n=1 Tax=Anas platyrhynchos TaxID=8839 RepID=UPI003AF22144
MAEGGCEELRQAWGRARTSWFPQGSSSPLGAQWLPPEWVIMSACSPPLLGLGQRVSQVNGSHSKATFYEVKYPAVFIPGLALSYLCFSDNIFASGQNLAALAPQRDPGHFNCTDLRWLLILYYKSSNSFFLAGDKGWRHIPLRSSFPLMRYKVMLSTNYFPPLPSEVHRETTEGTL